ncbi:hypothetical protein FXO37_34228 [Capsicum annuum]|nr:hypothetical protein FXO37_34228 [Capsicum annuum]
MGPTSGSFGSIGVYGDCAMIPEVLRQPHASSSSSLSYTLHLVYCPSSSAPQLTLFGRLLELPRSLNLGISVFFSIRISLGDRLTCQEIVEVFIKQYREIVDDSTAAFLVAIALGDERYIEKIREAQKAIDLPNVVCVDARGLQLKEDKSSFNHRGSS